MRERERERERNPISENNKPLAAVLQPCVVNVYPAASTRPRSPSILRRSGNPNLTRLLADLQVVASFTPAAPTAAARNIKPHSPDYPVSRLPRPSLPDLSRLVRHGKSRKKENQKASPDLIFFHQPRN
jgi:hypothetical protein